MVKIKVVLIRASGRRLMDYDTWKTEGEPQPVFLEDSSPVNLSDAMVDWLFFKRDCTLEQILNLDTVMPLIAELITEFIRHEHNDAGTIRTADIPSSD